MILENIKKQTSDNHYRLEQSQLLQPVTTPSLTLSHYCKILKVFYGHFYPLEKEISKIALVKQYLPDYDLRRKASLIKEDLLKLKAIDPAEGLEICHDLPAINTVSQAFGCLYVTEGSTLGGRVIAKSVKKHINVDFSSGASFFHGYGKDTGSKWKDFQQALSCVSLNLGTDRELIQAANDTFQQFVIWINKY